MRPVYVLSAVRTPIGKFGGAFASLTAAVPSLLALVERSGARLVHLSTHQASLEDVFVALTGRALRDA